MVLVILTFALTIFGTFLTRSWVISSVHSFTQSGLGPFFMGFLLFCLACSIGLLVWRLPLLKSKNDLESVFSREAAFLLNNLVLVGIAFTVFWGTVFPVISEWVRGVKITVGPPFFNRVNAPLALALMMLMGVGPAIAWRRANAHSLWRTFRWPLASGIVCGALVLGFVQANFYAVVAFSISAFGMTVVWLEFWRGARVRQAMLGETLPRALSRLIGKNRRRYGGYVIHVGVTMVFVGVVASSVFKVEVQKTVKQGESIAIGAYTLTFDSIRTEEDAHVSRTIASVSIAEGDGVTRHKLAQVEPEKRFYKKPQQPTTEVSIWTTLGRDLYVVLGSWDPQSQLATFQAYINPLIAWMWIGGAVMALGMMICMLPTPAERAATAQDAVPSGARVTR
jgi:cytochrome c-type biogenesis protein CcmF